MPKGTCSLPECDTSLNRYREYCDLHYNRNRKYGDPRWQPKPRIPLEARFWAKVRKSPDPGGCWIWTGSKSEGRYGSFNVAGVIRPAHCVAYELATGPIPDGAELDHLCRQKLCVRPDHLEPVTHKVNVLRGKGPTAQNAQKDMCSRGHPFDLINTYWRTDGGRRCRACKRLQRRR